MVLSGSVLDIRDGQDVCAAHLICQKILGHSNTPQGEPRDTKCFLKHSAHINAQINQSPHEEDPGAALLYLPLTYRKAGDTESTDKRFIRGTEDKSVVKRSYKMSLSGDSDGGRARTKAPLAGN